MACVRAARGNARRATLPVLLFVGAAIAGLTPVADGDIYWHLAAGREIMRGHAWLYSDPFSVSAAGRPWIDVHWLFQLAVYALHCAGGLWALLGAKCLLIGLGAVLLYAAVERRARPLFVASCLAALFAARHLLLMRPVIVSLVLLACFFLQLERFRRSGRIAALAPLPAVQVLWSNCQGLSALGPALVLAYALAAWSWLWLGQRTWFAFAPETAPALPARAHARALAGLLALCVGASLVTPYGLSGFTLPANLLARLVPATGNPYEQVAENVPPFALDRTIASQFWHVKWFIGWLALSYALSRRVVLSHLLLVLGFGALALMSNRNVLLFYWVASPIAASQLMPAARRALFAWRRYRAPRIARFVSRAGLTGLLALMITAAAREPNLGEPVPFRFPTASAPRIAQHPGQGAIFCADQQGGYLIWALYPRWKPYLDTRLGLRTAAQFSEYLALADSPERFGQFARQHGFSYAVLPVGYPDRYLGLISYLYRHPDWRLIFTDGAEVLFAHRELAPSGWNLAESKTTDRVLADMHRRYTASPRLHDAALVQFAMLDVAVSEFAQAQRVLSHSRSPAGLALRARTWLAAGDMDPALELGEQRASVVKDDVRNLVLMALIYGHRGRLQSSLDYLRQALAIDPLDGEALALLATIEEQQHDP
jgi:hypothetical protein